MHNRAPLSLYPHSTLMYRVCMYCHELVGVKDGGGIAGVTSSVCPPCLDMQIGVIGERRAA